jgi:hypothetical protein
VSAA